MGYFLRRWILVEKKQEIFKNFQAKTCNESLQSLSPSLTGFNIQASVLKIVTSERREKSLMKQGKPAEPCTHYVMWRI